MDFLRDRTYLGSLAALAAVCAIAIIFAAASSSDSDAPIVVVPTSTASAPVATPTRFVPTAADAARRADLSEIAAALDAYFAANGAYPATDGAPSTVCAEAFDPPCLLLSVVDRLPSGDGTARYWYVSDGATFTLFAAADDDTGSCRTPAPPQLAGSPVICVSAEGAP